MAARPIVVVDVERGPRVRVVFAGDPLPENRRETLVPIRQERSVDLDLLEDASRNIEAFLRQQGYRAAAGAVRRARSASGEMVLTFTRRRGPLHRLASIEVDGNTARSPTRRHRAAARSCKPGEPFVDSRVGDRGRGRHRALPRARLRARRGQARGHRSARRGREGRAGIVR